MLFPGTGLADRAIRSQYSIAPPFGRQQLQIFRVLPRDDIGELCGTNQRKYAQLPKAIGSPPKAGFILRFMPTV